VRETSFISLDHFYVLFLWRYILASWLLNLVDTWACCKRQMATENTEKWRHIHASNGIQINDAKVRALEDSTNMQGHCDRWI